ncbi:hypothetical protein [Lewinella cohaerens]|jgi:hypothetical protein|uniref:hypothetical protein n=1 Tax=Lewinella cohaerens TaxID=70995 RepID=UPI000361C1A5|nr:hypothetical protein [Lewinella cohaerens]
METSEIKNRPFQAKEDKERLFQALEDDEQLFKEALEVMLTLVVSDPKLTVDVADLIESDFRNIYLAIMKKIARENSNDKSMSCCSDIT